MKICYLHIGSHKTASSTLQLMLAANEGALEEHGLYLPRINGRPDNKQYGTLAMELMSGKDTREQRALGDILNKTGFPNRIVVSSETFCFAVAKTEARNRLVKYFLDLGYAINVIAYIRPQLLSINSHFTQMVKTLNFGKSFDQFVTDFTKTNKFDHLHRYSKLIEDKRFKVNFVPFNSALLRAGICSDFLGRLDIDTADHSGFVVPEDQNISPGPKTVAVLLRIAQALQDQMIIISGRTRSSAAKALQMTAQERSWNTEKFNGLTRAHKEIIIEKFSESNDRFARTVWSRPWREIFGEDEDAAMSKPPCLFHWQKAAEMERKEAEDFVKMGLQLIADMRKKEIRRTQTSIQ